MKELLGNSDFLTIHTGLNQDSSNMLGRDEFSKMKKSSYLINTARGVSLMKMIWPRPYGKSGFGGSVDTYSHEPLTKGNKLLRLSNLIVLPHIGSATVDTRTKMSRIAAQNLINVLDGSGPVCSVNTNDI